ncbi:transposase [Paraburkholderia saeva]|uniref:transposase n=1 Tax=Paraburkholderia saeva TaxID=2777537 RepID=UPI003898ED1B
MRRRRQYSAEFKTATLEQTWQRGTSVMGVARSHGLNPNMVRRWMREALAASHGRLSNGGQALVPIATPDDRTAVSVPASCASSRGQR